MNLAYTLRPQSLKDYVGQQHLVGKDKIIRKMIDTDSVTSMILWGPPGTGKTTLASIIAKETNSDFHQLSGVTSGKEDLKKIIDFAREKQLIGQKSILFIDEIHRWNKAQQDTLLPYVESGLITLIGATTENPSFEVISALLSRSRVFVLNSLGKEDLEKIGKKIIDIAKNKELANLELATLKIGPEKIETSNITAEEFSPENLIQFAIKYGPGIVNKIRGG